jgi:hypothetical protein
MVKRLYISICILVLGINYKSYSQNNLNDVILKQNFNYEVKQFSQFIDRLNYQEKIKPLNDSLPSKKLNIISLLNSVDTALINDLNTIEFVNSLSLNTSKISYTDTNWFSVANCFFYYKKIQYSVDIILELKGSNASGYKWIIANIICPNFFNSLKLEENANFINPMNHDVGFTELTKGMIDKTYLFEYLDQNEQPSNKIMFLTLVKTGELLFKQINEIKFNLLQFDNWIIEVKNFNRNISNSGWLISTILKVNSNEKRNYKQQFYQN